VKKVRKNSLDREQAINKYWLNGTSIENDTPIQQGARMPSLNDIDHRLRSPSARYTSSPHFNNLSVSLVLPASRNG
jgi:hypothetical protein